MTKFPSEKELARVSKLLKDCLASRPLPKNASVVDKTKFSICEKFVIYKNGHEITQRALAKKIGVDEAIISKILHYHFDEFTVDRLIKYLEEIYPSVDFEINVA